MGTSRAGQLGWIEVQMLKDQFETNYLMCTLGITFGVFCLTQQIERRSSMMLMQTITVRKFSIFGNSELLLNYKGNLVQNRFF